MYLQHFGLRHPPLSKQLTELWDDGVLAQLSQRFNWLLQSPGIGLLTGEPGVGKTAALRSLTHPLNPHRYQVLYQSETDFGRVDIYRSLARELGLEPSYRRAQLWRDIKQRVHEMVDSKQLTPLWIIDEAQNLPAEFFRDFPSFLNFAFDSRDLTPGVRLVVVSNEFTHRDSNSNEIRILRRIYRAGVGQAAVPWEPNGQVRGPGIERELPHGEELVKAGINSPRRFGVDKGAAPAGLERPGSARCTA